MRTLWRPSLFTGSRLLPLCAGRPNEQWAEKHSDPKTKRLSLRTSNELTKEREAKDARESYKPPSLISHEKHHWKSLRFLRQKVSNNYKLRIRGRAFLQASFFSLQLASFSALIFEPIKLRQVWAFAKQHSGERGNKSHWASIEVSGSHWNSIPLVWYFDSRGLANERSQSAKAWCVYVCVYVNYLLAVFVPAAAATQSKWHRLRKPLLTLTLCGPHSAPLTQMMDPHFHLQLPWWYKCTFMRRWFDEFLHFGF